MYRKAEREAPAQAPADGQPLARKPSTVGDGVRLLGRIFFWLLAFVVVLRGSDDLLGFPPAESSQAARGRRAQRLPGRRSRL